jgi:predicted nucleic acid-binding protein
MIVVDAGPLIALASTNHLGVLTAVAGDVFVTQTVFAECTVDMNKPGALTILEAIQQNRITLVADPDMSHVGLDPRVDDGEATAIILASQIKCPVLLDEVAARTFAKRLNIGVVGSAGILLAAKKNGLVPAVMPLLAAWKDSIEYRFSDAFLEAVRSESGE